MGLGYLAFTQGVGVSLVATTDIMSNVGAATKVRLKYGSWAPRIPKRTRNQLRPHGNYDLVQEKMVLQIRGASATDAFTQLNTLNNILNNSDEWVNGRSATPTYINYQPAGSALVGTWYSFVYGVVSFDVTEDFNATSQTFLITVNLVFLRLGEWFYSSLDISTTITASVAEQYTHSLPVLATADATPYHRIAIATNVGYFVSNNWPNAIFAITTDSDGILVFRPDAVTSGGSGAVMPDTSAWSGNFRRYTTAGTAIVDPTNLAFTGSVYAVIVNLRNVSATTNWLLRINVGGLAYGFVNLDPITIDGTILNPTLYVAGIVTFARPGSANVNLTVQNLTGVSASLDINYLAFVKLRSFTQTDPCGAIIRLKGFSSGVPNTEMVIDPALLQSTQGQDRPFGFFGRYDSGTGLAFADWEGDPMITLRGSTLYSRLFQTGVIAANWRPTTAGVAYAPGIRIERRVQTLTPR
jgi:hypothetical protein